MVCESIVIPDLGDPYEILEFGLTYDDLDGVYVATMISENYPGKMKLIYTVDGVLQAFEQTVDHSGGYVAHFVGLSPGSHNICALLEPVL